MKDSLIKICKEIVSGYYDCANITFQNYEVNLDQDWCDDPITIRNYISSEKGIEDVELISKLAQAVLDYYGENNES